MSGSLTNYGVTASPNLPAATAGKSASIKLTMGSSYEGTVVTAEQIGLGYSVRLDSPAVVIHGCMHASGIVSHLLGYTLKMRIQVGTRVVVRWAGTGIIESMVTTEAPDMAGGEGRASSTSGLKSVEHFGKDLKDDAKFVNNRGATPFADMLEGEVDLTNAFQVGIVLQTHLAKLQAGGRASVEAHLLNDMVRIISDNYRHMSAFGDFEITNNGGIDCVWHGTSHPHEAWGAVRGGSFGKIGDDGTMDPSSVAETGRWRFSQYIGAVGGFISAFVTDPCKSLGILAQERAGKFHAHVDVDGSFVMRSVADIAFERVVRIPIPVQKFRFDSSSGKKKSDAGKLNTKFLTQWKYADTDHPWQAAYQLRDYARWLNTYHSYARFLQSEDFEVPTEAESPEPDINSDEADRIAANGSGSGYIEAYSCFRLMRDGSTVIMDGYGNCTTTTATGVHVSSVGDYRIEAAGNIYLIAGQNIFCKARRSIEILAQFGGLLMTGKTWIKHLCEVGSIWLKSDASSTKAADYEPAQDGDPKADFADYAIVLDAPDGSAAVLAGNSVRISADGQAEDDTIPNKSDDDVKGALILQAPRGPASVRSGKHLNLVTTGFEGEDANVNIKARGFIVIHAIKNLMAKVLGFDFNKKLILHPDGEVQATRSIRSKTVYATGQVYNKKTGYSSFDGEKGLPQHYNHTRDIADSGSTKEPEELTEGKEVLEALAARADRLTPTYMDKTLTSEEGGVYTTGIIGGTLMRSETERNLTEDETGKYGEWKMHEPIRGRRTRCLPFPGPKLRQGVIRSDTISLNKPSETSHASIPTKGRSPTQQAMIKRFRKNP